MVNEASFRVGVGMIVCNAKAQLVWAKRIGKESRWQFPQGGLHQGETPEVGLYRELYEELGLAKHDVALLGHTKDWLYYRYPCPKPDYDNQKKVWVGQKQIWFLLQLRNVNSAICLTRSDSPEFDQWQWVDYWYPTKHVVAFKRQLYQEALEELEVFLPAQIPLS